MEYHRKMPVPHQELSLATVTARVATLFPSSFRYSPLLRLQAGTFRHWCHYDPRTATTGNQRGVFTYPEGNRSEQARKHAQQTFGDAIGKVLTTPLPVSVFRPGCYSFCENPGPHYPPAGHAVGSPVLNPRSPPWQPYTFTRQRITVTTPYTVCHYQ